MAGGMWCQAISVTDWHRNIGRKWHITCRSWWEFCITLSVCFIILFRFHFHVRPISNRNIVFGSCQGCFKPNPHLINTWSHWVKQKRTYTWDIIRFPVILLECFNALNIFSCVPDLELYLSEVPSNQLPTKVCSICQTEQPIKLNQQ